MKKLSN